MTSSSLGLSCRIHSKGKSDDHYSQRRYDKPGKVSGFRAPMPRSLSSNGDYIGSFGLRPEFPTFISVIFVILCIWKVA